MFLAFFILLFCIILLILENNQIMGCTCKKTEQEKERLVEFKPESSQNLPSNPGENISTEKDTNGRSRPKLRAKGPLRKNDTGSIYSDVLSANQEKDEILFNTFNEILANPKKFENEIEKYGLTDIFKKYEQSPSTKNNLFANPFYNILLGTYIEKYNDNEEDQNEFFKTIEENENIKDYEKKLFISNGSEDNINEAIWNLFAKNKETVLDDILLKKNDYLIISTMCKNDSNSFYAFFLFLKRK